MRLIEILDLKKYYASGMINKQIYKSSRWRFIPDRARRNPGPGGRERLRKDHSGPPASPAD